jgi:hypothetical protein
LVETLHVDDLHEPVCEAHIVDLDLDVFLVGVLDGYRTSVAGCQVKKRLQLANVDMLGWFLELQLAHLKEVSEEVGPVEEEVVFERA